MVALSAIQPGKNLLGGTTVQVWMRTGTGGRYYQHTADFDDEQEAYSFCWDCDRRLFIHKLESFIEQATNGLSFRWHAQKQWIGRARPQMQELRSYLAHVTRSNVAPEVMAQYAELVELALMKCQPPKFIQSAVELWLTLETLSAAFHEKYSVTENVNTNG